MTRASEIANLMRQSMPNRGSVLFFQEQGRRSSTSGYTQRMLAFFDALYRVEAPRPEVYTHPAAGHIPSRDRVPLSPVELAWLNRLPQDPTQISWDDARTLASMANSLSSPKLSADRRLVDSVWNPVREIHDHAAAEVQLRNAERPLPMLPDALGALADAVAMENPQLEPQDAIGRASRLLDQAAETRRATRERAIDAARRQLADLEQAHERRTAVVIT